jgi:hypothetical protein
VIWHSSGAFAAERQDVRRTSELRGLLNKIVRQVELHDAVLRAEMQGHDLVLTLDPIFVHYWEQLSGRIEGIGKWQSAVLRVSRGRWTSPPSAESTLLRGGWIQVGDVRFDGIIPFPLERSGAVHAQFAPDENFPLYLGFMGSGLTIELTGVPEGSEQLPAEWAPFGTNSE